MIYYYDDGYADVTEVGLDKQLWIQLARWVFQIQRILNCIIRNNYARISVGDFLMMEVEEQPANPTLTNCITPGTMWFQWVGSELGI